MLTLFVVAAVLADTAPTDWGQLIDRYGLPIALLVVIVAGARFLVPGWVHQRALADLDRERAAREELEAVLRNDVVPALVRSTEAQARTAAVLERVERRLDLPGAA